MLFVQQLTDLLLQRKYHKSNKVGKSAPFHLMCLALLHLHTSITTPAYLHHSKWSPVFRPGILYLWTEVEGLGDERWLPLQSVAVRC